MARLAGITGTAVWGIPDYALRRAVSLLGGYAKIKRCGIPKAAPAKTGMYGNDYDDISAIKQIADERDISIILVHHLRKLKDGDDPFNEVSGSTGIIGAAGYQLCAQAQTKRQRRHPSCLRAGCGISGADLTV